MWTIVAVSTTSITTQRIAAAPHEGKAFEEQQDDPSPPAVATFADPVKKGRNDSAPSPRAITTSTGRTSAVHARITRVMPGR